jgi:hypothetical protein
MIAHVSSATTDIDWAVAVTAALAYLNHRRHRRHSRAQSRFLQHVFREMGRGGRRRIRRHGEPFAETYSRHMASTAWRRQRDRVLARDRYRCRVCRSRYQLNVHHTFYTTPIGGEPDRSLVTLCATHHHEVHAVHRAMGGHPGDLVAATRRVLDRQPERVG